ncbi:MAG: TetR/AcrR family transcriptional regulator [Euryarchaeota archaeon]|nr:TetR/AcrR family transcriptional regulator [Euryarchaeota archaeon]
MSPKEKTEKKILDAGLKLFSCHGYIGTTTKRIAEKAGITEVTLFRHFGSKRNLFYAVLEREADVEDKIPEGGMIPTEDIPADLTKIGMFVFKNMVPRAKFMKIVMVETSRNPEVFEHISSAPFEVLGKLIEYFSQAKSKGLLRNIDPNIAAIAFFSFFFRSVIAKGFLGEDVFMEMNQDSIQKFVEIFVNGTKKR